jgi:hypothetical protein
MARSPEATDSIQRTTRRRWSLGLNAAAAVTLAALLVAMLNYLAQRNYARADWSRTRFYSLSDKTTHLLASLSNRVDITMFFQTDHPFYEDVANLLQEYTYQSPLLRVEKVDPNRNLARTEELSRRYQVTELNVVVFDHHGRSKVVRADDLMEMDYSGLAGGEPPRASAFKGEQVFSSALQSIAQERPPKVYFLGGHGERDINDRDPYAGYSELARRVRGDNAEAIDFTLAAQHGVPADADAVVIPGPTKPLAAQEIDTLQAWVEKKNGRLMVLLDTGPFRRPGDPARPPGGCAWINDVVLDPEAHPDRTGPLRGRLRAPPHHAPPPADHLRLLHATFRGAQPSAPRPGGPRRPAGGELAGVQLRRQLGGKRPGAEAHEVR